MKFSPGDAVVKTKKMGRIPYGKELIVKEVDEEGACFYVEFESDKYECNEDTFELAEVFNSPLFKAMEEK